MGLKGIVAVLSVGFSLAQGYGQKETVEETVKNFQVRWADLGLRVVKIGLLLTPKVLIGGL